MEKENKSAGNINRMKKNVNQQSRSFCCHKCNLEIYPDTEARKLTALDLNL